TGRRTTVPQLRTVEPDLGVHRRQTTAFRRLQGTHDRVARSGPDGRSTAADRHRNRHPEPMNTRFETLFTVGVSHAYYSSECEDFEFFVTPDTARLLRNGKLIAKMRKGTLYVLFEADEVRSPLARIGGKTLRFGLKLLNPFFSHITEWNPDSFIPFYRNSTNPDHLDSAEKTSLVGRLFSHGLSASERPVTVTLKNSGGGIARTETIAASN